MTRVPFGEPTELPEFVATTKGRIVCEGCGEFVYPLRPVKGGPAELPVACPLCETPTGPEGESK